MDMMNEHGEGDRESGKLESPLGTSVRLCRTFFQP